MGGGEEEAANKGGGDDDAAAALVWEEKEGCKNPQLGCGIFSGDGGNWDTPLSSRMNGAELYTEEKHAEKVGCCA